MKTRENGRHTIPLTGPKGPAAVRARGLRRAVFLIAAAVSFISATGVSAMEKLSGGAYLIARNTVAAEGRRTSSGGLVLNTTVGEVGTAAYSGGSLKLYPGYVKLAAQPGSVTSITAVTKSTGTLELAWNAPGLDGFSGDVPNGFYRVDYSSDPAHLFRPTAFKLEFSTAVTAGAAQALLIPGLQPNTTYYTKIYLADAQKYFSEDSKRSGESTLANMPVNPFFSAVSGCKTTVSWTLPAGGAEGYGADASSTSFSGGSISSSSTASGLQFNMTLSGLQPGTTYYFKVASRNWQGDKNYAAVIATVTLSGGCVEKINDLSTFVNALSRSITLTWANPADPFHRGVLVVMSTNPVISAPDTGVDYSAGQTLDGGAVVKLSTNVTTFTDTRLTLDVPYFYHVYTQNTDLAYSVSVSTSVFLDLPPMAPAGLTATVAPDRANITLNWANVTSNLDGSMFAAPAAPRDVELSQYRIDRATSVANPAWVAVGTVPVSSMSYTAAIPDPARTYYYRVSAMDTFGAEDISMAVDTGRNLFVLSPDQVTRLELPSGLGDELLAGNNKQGKNLLLRAVEEPENETPRIFKSVRFEAVTAEDNKVVDKFGFSKPVELTLAYNVSGNNVVAAHAASVSPESVPVPAAAAASNLGMYWNNGDKYVKLYGAVDTADRTLAVKTTMSGSYQIRRLVRDSGVTFDISNLSNKMITPNGDGLNDEAVFTFDNPKDSAFSGKIFDAGGAFVSDMKIGPIPYSLKWDAKSNGRVVQGGVYVYQIRAEGKVFTGTLIVIK